MWNLKNYPELYQLDRTIGPWVLGLSILFLLLEFVLWAQPLPTFRWKHAVRNLVIGFMNLRVLGFGGALVVLFAVHLQENHWGLLNHFEVSPSWVVIAISILFYDFLNYGIHRTLHKFPTLWKIHRLHHTDSYLDFTSAFYFHPLESVYRLSAQTLVVGALGLPSCAIALHTFFVTAALLSSHTNIRIPAWIESWAKYIFVLPTAHRVHHSQIRHEHDSNYGITFMFWDHIFGTYTAPNDRNQFRIGLQSYNSHLGIVESLIEPFTKQKKSRK